MNTIQHSPRRSPLYVIGVSLGPPVLDANGIPIASAVFAGLTIWQTKKPHYSVGNNRRHLHTQFCNVV